MSGSPGSIEESIWILVCAMFNGIFPIGGPEAQRRSGGSWQVRFEVSNSLVYTDTDLSSPISLWGICCQTSPMIFRMNIARNSSSCRISRKGWRARHGLALERFPHRQSSLGLDASHLPDESINLLQKRSVFRLLSGCSALPFRTREEGRVSSRRSETHAGFDRRLAC